MRLQKSAGTSCSGRRWKHWPQSVCRRVFDSNRVCSFRSSKNFRLLDFLSVCVIFVLGLPFSWPLDSYTHTFKMVSPNIRPKIVKKRTKKFTRHQSDRYDRVKVSIPQLFVDLVQVETKEQWPHCVLSTTTRAYHRFQTDQLNYFNFIAKRRLNSILILFCLFIFFFNSDSCFPSPFGFIHCLGNFRPINQLRLLIVILIVLPSFGTQSIGYSNSSRIIDVVCVVHLLCTWSAKIRCFFIQHDCPFNWLRSSSWHGVNRKVLTIAFVVASRVNVLCPTSVMVPPPRPGSCCRTDIARWSCKTWR